MDINFRAMAVAALSAVGAIILENDAGLVRNNIASWTSSLGLGSAWTNIENIGLALRIIIYGTLLISGLFLFFGTVYRSKNSTTMTIDNSVSSINQSGGITARNVTIGNRQRKLGKELKAELLKNLDKVKPIDIIVAMNDHEADIYAHEIKDFLTLNGYSLKYETMLYESMSGGRGIPYLGLGDDINEITVGSNVNLSDQISFLGSASRPVR